MMLLIMLMMILLILMPMLMLLLMLMLEGTLLRSRRRRRLTYWLTCIVQTASCRIIRAICTLHNKYCTVTCCSSSSSSTSTSTSTSSSTPVAPVLCCAMQCCAVLCCAVLCCAVLCCAVSSSNSLSPHRTTRVVRVVYVVTLHVVVVVDWSCEVIARGRTNPVESSRVEWS
jgi:hypothetical protein